MKHLSRWVRSKQLWWLVGNLVGLGLFFAISSHGPWVNWVTQEVTAPVRQALGRVSYLVSWSVMEVLYTAAAGVAVVYVGYVVGQIVAHPGQRLAQAWRGTCTVVNVVFSVYVSFCLLWGLNYYADGFQEQSGIYALGGTVEELTALTAYFAQETSARVDDVVRDETGLFAHTREEIFAQATTVYDAVEAQYPFLAFADEIPKPMSFSVLMSRMNFTGYYSAYTGESNLNVHSPAVVLPFTIAHELAHQRSIASEQEANFLAVLAATTSGNPVYAYAGYLMGYVYLSNALYAQDYEAWYAIYQTLPMEVMVDLADNSDYWAQYRNTTISQVGQSTYDAFLKNYGQADGIQSYGTVVDLMLAYYD